MERLRALALVVIAFHWAYQVKVLDLLLAMFCRHCMQLLWGQTLGILLVMC